VQEGSGEMIIKNCKFCQHYQHEEVGDSDYGAIYSDEPVCLQEKDWDEKDETIASFDRDVERDCCALDFLKVADVDNEVGDLFDAMDIDEDGIMDKAYAKFKEKYLVS